MFKTSNVSSFKNLAQVNNAEEEIHFCSALLSICLKQLMLSYYSSA